MDQYKNLVKPNEFDFKQHIGNREFATWLFIPLLMILSLFYYLYTLDFKSISDLGFLFWCALVGVCSVWVYVNSKVTVNQKALRDEYSAYLESVGVSELETYLATQSPEFSEYCKEFFTYYMNSRFAGWSLRHPDWWLTKSLKVT